MDEAQDENILSSAVVTFEDRVSQAGFGVELDFLVASADEVVDDVRCGAIAAGATEPLVASQALDDRGRGMDPAVTKMLGSAGVSGQRQGRGPRTYEHACSGSSSG